MKSPRAWVIPALLLAVLIWGCVYSSIKYVQREIPPTGLATCRIAFGAILLLEGLREVPSHRAAISQPG